MSPVKPEEDIRTAYFDYNVRVFALHSEKELDKIVRATTKDGRQAEDLKLFVRLKVTSPHAKLDLNPKFGIEGTPAIELLRRTEDVAFQLGICFHIGSQITDASGFSQAMRQVHQLQSQAGVRAVGLSVGGGFGCSYPGSEAPTVTECLETIVRTGDELFGHSQMKIFCEPGRALCAKSESLVVRVEERRGMELYINDGAYGILSDAGKINWRFETKLLRVGPSPAENQAFSFWGPTGDSLDYMRGPFYIPEDVKEGDYIEIMHTGAYGQVLASRFNGFGGWGKVTVGDLGCKEITTSP
jgi:ornithine decarboxylase